MPFYEARLDERTLTFAIWENPFMAKIVKALLSLAGEFRVCSELLKRGVFTTITYGNHKGVDLYAIPNPTQRALRIEVKTSQKGRFVTNIARKDLKGPGTAPDFWILFHLRANGDESFLEEFFVLTHKELIAAQSKVNALWRRKYLKKHGQEFVGGRGVDNVSVINVMKHKEKWSKITKRLTLAAD